MRANEAQDRARARAVRDGCMEAERLARVRTYERPRKRADADEGASTDQAREQGVMSC